MRIYYLLFFTILTITGYSQITITSSDMPDTDDTLRYSTAIVDGTTLATYETSGANMTWDFSHLQPIGQNVDEYKSSLQTPYAFFFFGFDKFGLKLIDTVDLGPVSLTNVYDFYKNSSTKFEAEGRGVTVGGLPLPSFYTDNDEIYQFPLQYNDRDSSTFDYAISFLTIGSLRTAGYRINTVDGWGQITTPYGTFDCIRVVTDIVSSDSISAGGVNIGIPNARREYKWLAKGEAFPILEISGSVVAGLFIPANIRYRDDYRDVPSIFAPVVDFTADNTMPEAFCDTVTLLPEIGGFPFLGTSYEWNIAPSTYSYVNGTDSTSEEPQVIFYGLGTYDVTLKATNNFDSTDSTKTAYINVTQIDLEKVNAEMNLYPNPAMGNYTILKYSLPATSSVQIDVFDMSGRYKGMILNEEQQAGRYQSVLNLSNYANGVYAIRLIINDEQTMYRLVVGN